MKTLNQNLSHIAWNSLGPKRAPLRAASHLLNLIQKKFLQMGETPSNLGNHRPRLKIPTPPIGTLSPPRYFSKGPLDFDRRRTPPPIAYLLTETREIAEARPISGPSLLLSSLCKGKGVLRRNEQGFAYLDIDNRFILSLIPYLKAYGLIRPPYFNLFSAPEGAHIPAISPRESAFHFLEHLPDEGKEFSFIIEGLYSIEPTLWPEIEQIWFFKIKSPELEALRRKLFLPEKLGGHPFHIAVAVKPRITARLQPTPLPMMRINVAYLAA